MILDKIITWADERSISSQPPDKNGFVKNIVSELGEFIDDDREYGEVDAIADIMIFCITELAKYRMNPRLVLEECYLEINSRIGAWSDEEQKWLKFKTPEAKALWVTADYSKCYAIVEDTQRLEKEALRNYMYGVL